MGDVIETEVQVASVEDQEDDNDTDMLEGDMETCATATASEITLSATSQSNKDDLEEDSDVCPPDSEMNDECEELMADIINDIVETATNQYRFDLSPDNNLEIKEASCSEEEKEESDVAKDNVSEDSLNLVNINETEEPDSIPASPTSSLEDKSSNLDEEPTEEDKSHEYDVTAYVETVKEETKNMASAESPSGNREFAGVPTSDEETEETDENNSDIIEKHVRRDSNVSVPSVSENSDEKLER